MIAKNKALSCWEGHAPVSPLCLMLCVYLSRGLYIKDARLRVQIMICLCREVFVLFGLVLSLGKSESQWPGYVFSGDAKLLTELFTSPCIGKHGIF